MFAVGETITYSSIGVCKINEITENKLTGVLRKYYVLLPVDTDKNVIYVPVDNEKLVSRMRAVPTKKELKTLLSQVNGDSVEWIENNLERSQVYRDILADGDMKNNIRLLRTLHARSLHLKAAQRHLPKSDERIYKDCTKLIASQLSTILETEQDQVLQMVLCDEI